MEMFRRFTLSKNRPQATPTHRRQVVYSVLTFTQVRERKLKVKQNHDVYQVQSQNRRLKRKKNREMHNIGGAKHAGICRSHASSPIAGVI